MIWYNHKTIALWWEKNLGYFLNNADAYVPPELSYIRTSGCENHWSFLDAWYEFGYLISNDYDLW